MSFEQLCQQARLRLLRMHYDSKVGHLGGNLSCLDALLFLHHQVMQNDDTFVLAKGHAAGALYITLWSIGRLSDADLAQFHREPWPWFSGVDGHGLSQTSSRNIRTCILSDVRW